MKSFRRPSAAVIRQFLEAQGKLDFTYKAVGATANDPPSGYVLDHVRVKLGEGEEVFEKAKAALGRWEQFDLGWVEAWPTDAPIEVGAVVAILAWRAGLWWLNACKVVYVVDDPGPVRRYGFAYGTLPDHAGTGEERFLVEWDRASGEVWYDVMAFSKPHWFLSRLGYRYMRGLQKKFGRGSMAAMRKAVGGA